MTPETEAQLRLIARRYKLDLEVDHMLKTMTVHGPYGSLATVYPFLAMKTSYAVTMIVTQDESPVFTVREESSGS